MACLILTLLFFGLLTLMICALILLTKSSLCSFQDNKNLSETMSTSTLRRVLIQSNGKHSRNIDPTMIGSPNTRPKSKPRSGQHSLSTYVETHMYFVRIHYEWAWMVGFVLLVLVLAWASLLVNARLGHCLCNYFDCLH